MSVPAKNKITIHYYKTNVGVFIRNLWGGSYNNYQATPHFDAYKFNGIIGNNNLLGTYMFLKGESSIDKVEVKKASHKFLMGYELKEDISDALKSTLKPFYTTEETGYCYEDDTEEYLFSSKEFNSVKGMYVAKYGMTEEKWEEVDVELILLGELFVENYDKPEKMVIRVQQESGWSSKTVEVDLASFVCYEDFERMLTPDFMMHTRPCTLTSSQVYKIVRAYVKENINHRVAEITSDYDFCFTVKRKIGIKPIPTRRGLNKANGRSYATPRFSTQTTSYKSVPLFEMTDDIKRYQGYTVINGWKADSLQEMKDQMKQYLDALMAEINTEWKECECCGGVGAVGKKIDTNERE